MAWARGLCVRTTCVTLPRAMQIPFFLSGVQKVENALVDSGATDNFITPLLVKWLGLRAQKLWIPKPILTVDGLEHKQGRITDYVDLILKLGEQWRKQRFYIATLGQDRAILGFPFLNKFNPNINWTKNKITSIAGVQIEPELVPQEDILIRILWLQNNARKQCGEPQLGESLHYTIRKVSFTQQWAAAVTAFFDPTSYLYLFGLIYDASIITR
jgi:hypothetical protein